MADETMGAACGRCGLPVSRGICDADPHVFHDRPEQCIAALRARAERAEKDRDDAIERAEEEERRCSSMVSARDLTIRALRDQIAHEGCEASRIGEYTYHCDATKPCGLCRLRGRAERYREALETADKAVQASERLLAQDTRPLDTMTTDAYRAWKEWRDTLTPALTAIAVALAATGDEDGNRSNRG